MRIYISGPISGTSDYRERFGEAQKFIESAGFQVINPVAMEDVLPEMTYEEYMKLDMCMLEMCSAIYMLRGWEKSLGANREYGYALAKEMQVMWEEEQ